jgi:hypothetical protein
LYGKLRSIEEEHQHRAGRKDVTMSALASFVSRSRLGKSGRAVAD